jgi:hypothetical protein
MAVRRVDDHDVHAGVNELGDALVGVDRRADRGADAQRAACVLACVWIVVRLLNVFHRDHAAQPERLVDDEHFLDAVTVE